MTDLGETMFASPEMAAIFSGQSMVQRMLDVEAALARAQARAGMIPQQAAAAIGAKCRVELFNLEALFHDAAEAGTPAIPLVRMLTELVDEDTRKAIHLGVTSQDVIDTATMLQIRGGVDLLIARLLDIAQGCAALAERHRHTPMAGRTLLQHAVPITFGLKAARWLALSTRLVRRLREVQDTTLVVQLGGAAGYPPPPRPGGGRAGGENAPPPPPPAPPPPPHPPPAPRGGMAPPPPAPSAPP